MTDRTRVVALLECPAALRPTLGRLLKMLSRRYSVRCLDFAETTADRLACPMGSPEAQGRADGNLGDENAADAKPDSREGS